MQGFSKPNANSLQWPSFVQPQSYQTMAGENGFKSSNTYTITQATSVAQIVAAYDSVDPEHADKLRAAVNQGKNPFSLESKGYRATFIATNDRGEPVGVISHTLEADAKGALYLRTTSESKFSSTMDSDVQRIGTHHADQLTDLLSGKVDPRNTMKVDAAVFGKLPDTRDKLPKPTEQELAETPYYLKPRLRFPIKDVRMELPPLTPIPDRALPADNVYTNTPASGPTAGGNKQEGIQIIAPFVSAPAPLSARAEEGLATTFTEQAFNDARRDLGMTGEHPTYADFKIQINQPLYFVEQARNIARHSAEGSDITSLMNPGENEADTRFRLNNAAYIAQQVYDDSNKIARHITDRALDRSAREGFPTPSVAERQEFAEKNKPTSLQIANMAYRLQQGTAAGDIQEINSAKTLSGGKGKVAAWLQKTAENLNTVARGISSMLLNRASQAAQLPAAGLSILAASASQASANLRQKMTLLANAYAERQHRYANPTPGDIGAMLLSGRGDVQRWVNSGGSGPAPKPYRTLSRRIDDIVGRAATIALRLKPAENLVNLKNFVQDRAIAAQSVLHSAYNKVNDGVQGVLISDTFNKFRSNAGKTALGLTVAGGLAHMIGPHSAMAADYIATLLHNGSLSPIQPSDVTLGGHTPHLAGSLLTSTAGQVEQLTKSAHDYMAAHSANPNLISVANDQAISDGLKAGLDHAQHAPSALHTAAFKGAETELGKAMHDSNAQAFSESTKVAANLDAQMAERGRLAPDATDVFINEHFPHSSIDEAARHAAAPVIAGVEAPHHTMTASLHHADGHTEHAASAHHHDASPEVTVTGHRHLNADTLNAREQVAINDAKHDGRDFSALREFDAKKGTFSADHSVQFASDKHPDAPAPGAPAHSAPAHDTSPGTAEQRFDDMTNHADHLMKSGKFSLVVDPDNGRMNVVETSSLHQHGAKPGSIVFNQDIKVDAQRLGLEGHDGSFLNEKDAHHFAKHSPMAHIQSEAAHGVSPSNIDLQAVNDMSNYAKERNMALFVDGKGIAFTVNLEGHLTPDSEVIINTPKGMTGVSLSKFEHVQSLGADMTPAIRGETAHEVAANYQDVTQGGGSAHVQVAQTSGKVHDISIADGEVSHSAVKNPEQENFFDRVGHAIHKEIVEPVKQQAKDIAMDFS